MLNTFTWSKFIDDVQANSELAGNSYQSYYARRIEKALSGNDIRYRWASSFVYELPAGRGRKFDIQNRAADHILGGWSLGLITELRTGSPYGVYELSNRLNAFGGSQRSNITGDPDLPGNRPRAEFVRQWFDTTVFAFPGNALLGNSGKAVGYGPGFANFDASLLKDFRLGERPVLQLRGEFFNLFNRANFNRPNTSRGGANFGTISSTRNDGRFIQVGLRLSY